MKQLSVRPYLLLRAAEWAFGLIVVAMIGCAFVLGWFGSLLDSVASAYAEIFTQSFEVRHVHRPPDTALEGYVPGYGIHHP